MAREVSNGVGCPRPLRLVVDRRIDAEELRRFEGLVVSGPGADDCAIWVGPIGADSYGRFWVRRGGGERIMLRANRYALAAARDGVALQPWVRALHGCNNPACVRVSRPGETGLLHVVGGSQRDNMLMMAGARRGGGRAAIRTRGAGVAARRARAVAVRCGWDADAVAAALLGSAEAILW